MIDAFFYLVLAFGLPLGVVCLANLWVDWERARELLKRLMDGD